MSYIELYKFPLTLKKFLGPTTTTQDLLPSLQLT